MTTNRWQFSLRALLIVVTLMAIGIALTAHHPKVVIGLGLFAAWVLEVVAWFVPAFLDLRGPKTTEQVRREKKLAQTSDQ
jgi:hypothetical protein